MPVYPGVGLHTTNYRVSDEHRKWMEAELADYINPQYWELQREKDGKTMWRRNPPAELVKAESKVHRNAAYWKFAAVLPGSTVDDIYGIMHREGARYQQYLSEGYDGGELIEIISPDRIGGACDEAVIQRRAYKLAIVSNRDFVTITLQKNFKMPNGTPVIGLFTKSVFDYPKEPPVPKGYVRGEVISCCAFLSQTPEGCLYSYTQRAQLNLNLPIPAGVMHYGEKAHIWRHFDVMRRCVEIYQKDQRLVFSPSATPVTPAPPALPPAISPSTLTNIDIMKTIETYNAENADNTLISPVPLPNAKVGSFDENQPPNGGGKIYSC